MGNKFFLAAVFFAAIFILQAMPAMASIQLQAPDRAGRGNAFLAKAVSDEPVREISFIWRGKRYTVATYPLAAGGVEAKILLPVALDEKGAELQLSAQAPKGSPARKVIKIDNVQRPVQKLNVDKKYVTPPPDVQEKIKADREKVRQALRSQVETSDWDVPFFRPVSGGVSSQFGLKRVFNGQPRGMHKGLDLRGAAGTPIRACADGTVVLVDNLYYSGNTVYVNHGNGVLTAYLHMSAADVKPGDKVRRGQIIGKVGATGRVTGPHLHLSLFAQGESVDPLPLLEKNEPQGVPAKSATRGTAK